MPFDIKLPPLKETEEERTKEQYLKITVILDPNANIEEIMKRAGAILEGKEEYTEYLFSKEEGGKGIPEYYLVRHWPRPKENPRTVMSHLGYELGQELRDVEVQVESLYTAQENLSEMGFSQIFEDDVRALVYSWGRFRARVMITQKGLLYLELVGIYTGIRDKERKTKQMEDLVAKIGVVPENIYHGSALQYTIEIMQKQPEEEEEDYEEEPEELED